MSPSVTPFVKRLRPDPFSHAVGQAVDLVLIAIQRAGTANPNHPGLIGALDGINMLNQAAQLSREFVNPPETLGEEAQRKRLFLTEENAMFRKAWMPEKRCLAKESSDRCDTATGNAH